MAIEIYADLEEVAAEVAEVEVTAEVETTETDEAKECNTIAPEEVETSDAPEASSQEEETTPVQVTGYDSTTKTAHVGPLISDLLSQISNQELRCKRAEWVVIEKKEALKDAKEEYEGCIAELRRLCSQLQNDSPENRPLFANLEAKVEAVEEEGDSREEEPTAPTEPSWKSLTVDALPDITPKTKEQLRDGGINTLSELAELITRCEHDSTAAWPKGIGKVKQTAICDALITVQDLERCQGSEGVPVTEVEAVYPTAEEWETWSESKQTRWLEDRADVLEAGDVATPELMKTVQWEQGFDAHDDGMKIENCELLPGADCDAWICGWLRAKDQSEE